MRLTFDLFHYNHWAMRQMLDFCQRQPAGLLEQIVVGTDRSILHTLTHLIGSEQEYLQELLGIELASPLRAGQVLTLDEVRQRCDAFLPHWETALERLDRLDVTIPADGPEPEIPHGQDLLCLQALQHGIDHRAQICTTLTTLGLEPPRIDGWEYWRAEHPSK
jgi:uncharacterized damage-inducible protein DinB